MAKGHPLPPWRNRVKKFTPIIRGEDAKRFLQRMMENHKETPEERDRREANYEMIMKNSEGYL